MLPHRINSMWLFILNKIEKINQLVNEIEKDYLFYEKLNDAVTFYTKRIYIRAIKI